MFAQPFLGRVPDNLFLLNPQHRGFLNGSDRKFKDVSKRLFIILMIMILLFGLIGGGMAYSGASEISARSQLEQSGVEAHATVIDTDYTTSTNKGHTTYTYYMTYEYFVRSANSDSPTRYTYRQEISGDNYDNLDRGSKLTIRYLPSDPSISRYLDDNAGDGASLAVIGGLFLAGTLAALYFLLRQRSRNQRLENEGQFITGKITKVSSARVKAGYQITVTYSILSPDGVELSRKESLVRNDLNKALLPQEGTPVAVVYVNDKLYRML